MSKSYAKEVVSAMHGKHMSALPKHKKTFSQAAKERHG